MSEQSWEVEVTCTQAVVAGVQRSMVKSVTVENCPRNVALSLGTDDVMKWAAEECTLDYTPIPRAAVAYWREARRNGVMPLYEIQNELEQWGISFIIKNVEQNQVENPPIPPAARNGRAAATPSAVPATSKLPDLATMLQERMQVLQGREKYLLEARRNMDKEYGEVRADIQQTTELLMTLKGPKRKINRAVKSPQDAEKTNEADAG